MHNDLMNLTSMSKTNAKKVAESFEDNNFFRKVSKYDLDSMSVNWSEYLNDRNRQLAENGKKRLANDQAAQKAFVTGNAIDKMRKMQEIQQQREAYIKDSKAMAIKNQEQLASMIKSVN